jgi:hypothetical protein
VLAAMTVWGLSFLLIPGVDRRDELLRTFSRRADSIQAIQNGAAQVVTAYKETLKNHEQRLHGRDGMASGAAKDSMRMAAVASRALAPEDREAARVAQIQLGAERRWWTLVNAREKQQARREMDSASARVKSVFQSSYAGVTARAKFAHALGDSLTTATEKESRRSMFALVAVLLGLLSISTFARYAITGRRERLPRFFRARLEPNAVSHGIANPGVTPRS